MNPFLKYSIIALIIALTSSLLFVFLHGQPPVSQEIRLVSATPVETIAPSTTLVQHGEAQSRWRTYRNQEYRFEFRYPDAMGIGYLDPAGGKYLSALSNAQVGVPNPLVIGTRDDAPLLSINVLPSKQVLDNTLLNERISEASIFNASEYKQLGGIRFTVYTTKGGRIFNGFQTLYVAEYGGRYYVIKLAFSEVAPSIFETFQFLN